MNVASVNIFVLVCLGLCLSQNCNPGLSNTRRRRSKGLCWWSALTNSILLTFLCLFGNRRRPVSLSLENPWGEGRQISKRATVTVRVTCEYAHLTSKSPSQSRSEAYLFSVLPNGISRKRETARSQVSENQRFQLIVLFVRLSDRRLVNAARPWRQSPGRSRGWLANARGCD